MTAPPVGWWLRYAGSCLLYYSGLLALYRFVRTCAVGPRIAILAYHGVNDRPPYIEMFTPTAIFAEQMRYLARHYEPWSLGQLRDWLRRAATPTKDAVVVTFDDGYRDNLEIAEPHARRHGIPIAIFLTTACIDQQQPTFVAALIDALDGAAAESLDLDDLGLGRLDLRGFAAKSHAIRVIDGHAKPMPEEARLRLLETVRRRLNFEPSGADIPVRTRMLTWDDARQMAGRGTTFGAHTVTHPVLSSLQDGAMHGEIEECATRIERELGVRPQHFAYPYGGPAEVDHRAVRIARECGYATAVLLQEKPVDSSKPHELGRIMLTLDRTARPDGRFSRALFACELAGVFTSLRFVARRLRGAA